MLLGCEIIPVSTKSQSPVHEESTLDRSQEEDITMISPEKCGAKPKKTTKSKQSTKVRFTVNTVLSVCMRYTVYSFNF